MADLAVLGVSAGQDIGLIGSFVCVSARMASPVVRLCNCRESWRYRGAPSCCDGMGDVAYLAAARAHRSVSSAHQGPGRCRSGGMTYQRETLFGGFVRDAVRSGPHGREGRPHDGALVKQLN